MVLDILLIFLDRWKFVFLKFSESCVILKQLMLR